MVNGIEVLARADSLLCEGPYISKEQADSLIDLVKIYAFCYKEGSMSGGRYAVFFRPTSTASWYAVRESVDHDHKITLWTDVPMYDVNLNPDYSYSDEEMDHLAHDVLEKLRQIQAESSQIRGILDIVVAHSPEVVGSMQGNLDSLSAASQQIIGQLSEMGVAVEEIEDLDLSSN